ncbi:MAG: hypothetical protein IKT08_04540 [Bacteroidales bacterium]|nr:hypothetical protein [Bacteroidales bacterium]
MKRRLISLTAAMLMAVGTTFGQIIITEEDPNHNRAEQNTSNIGVMVLSEGVDYDQWKYAPLDGGILLLAGLGAAYLAGKRKKQ